MSDVVTIVASLTQAPSSGAVDLPPGVEVLEVRADLTGELDPEALRDSFEGELLYTLRSSQEGGRNRDQGEDRRHRLRDASQRYDLVDLEAERDLDPELLAEIPPERRVISWHGPVRDLGRLTNQWEAMRATPARLYKLVPEAKVPGDELVPLRLLHHLRRRDVIAFASGRVATWSRHVAARLGAPWIFGAAGDLPAAAGQPSVRSLVFDYGYPFLRPAEGLFGVVGWPAAHSLSPRLHNAVYRELDLPYLYVAFEAPRFGDFWLEVVEGGGLDTMGMPILGLSVTTPHKGAALAVAAAASPLADRIGSANTLVCRDGMWEAENTDCEGVVRAFQDRGIRIAGERALVVGAGRAGRAAAVGLHLAGADVTLANRTVERGQEVADELGVHFVPLADLEPSAFRLVVQATTLGRRTDDEMPFPVERLASGAAVADFVYGDGPTPLLREVIADGFTAIDGREILLTQALGQVRAMTGREIPIELGRRVLGVSP